jgi:hypothetical protein
MTETREVTRAYRVTLENLESVPPEYVADAFEAATYYADGGDFGGTMWLVAEKDPNPKHTNDPWWAERDWWTEEHHKVLAGPVEYACQEWGATVKEVTR